MTAKEKKEKLKKSFCKKKRVDMFDYEYTKVFPYYSSKKGKWVSISKTQAYKWYCEWLEDLVIEMHNKLDSKDS